jgi:hypothetical protein
VLEGGEVTPKLAKVPLDRMEAWDEEHDAQGGKISSDGSSNDESPVPAVPVYVSKGGDVKI